MERARALAAAAGTARADVLQYHHTYLRMRTDIPDLRFSFSRDGEIGVADGSILSYLRAEPGMTLVAYSPLLNGVYARPGQELGRAYDHPGTRARLEALRSSFRAPQDQVPPGTRQHLPPAPPAPLTPAGACRSQVMNKPRCSTPACHVRPVRQHHRKYNAMPPAYALVVSSEPSRPNSTCRKNASASPNTTRSSSMTVQYPAPDGSLTRNARTFIPRSS